MKLINHIRKYVAVIVFIFCFVNAYGQTVRTVVPTNYKDSLVEVKTDESKSISFNLSTIPNTATVDSCFLHLTLQNTIESKMILEVKEKDTRINFISLDKSYKKDSTISIEVEKSLLIGKDSLLLTLIAPSGRKSKAKFYGSNVNNSPRLLVYYTLQTDNPQTWPMAHAGYQHSSQNYMRYGGANANSYKADTIATFNDIQKDLVMYKNNIILVNDVNSTINLWSVDPVTKYKTTIAGNISTANTMPVIDPFGRLYYFSENVINVYDLEDDNKNTTHIDIPNSKTVSALRTIGPDGSLYLVLNDIIYAYSPFPQHQLIWQYSIGGDKSPVTLNKEGSIAYVAYNKDGNNSDGRIISINTSNGKQLNSAAIILINKDNEDLTIPLVTGNGFVYVANKLIDADAMYVYNSTLNIRKKFTGNHISQPAACINDSIYFVNNGTLNVCTDTFKTDRKFLAADISVRSLVTDKSKNVYCLGNNNILYAYNKTSGKVIVTNPELPENVGFQRALIMGLDGTVYTATSSSLYGFRVDTVDDYKLAEGDKQLNNMVFRGKSLQIPASYSLDHKKILIGSSTVQVLENVTINSTADIIIESGGTISFGNGFSVQKGAKLSCKTGY